MLGDLGCQAPSFTLTTNNARMRYADMKDTPQIIRKRIAQSFLAVANDAGAVARVAGELRRAHKNDKKLLTLIDEMQNSGTSIGVNAVALIAEMDVEIRLHHPVHSVPDHHVTAVPVERTQPFIHPSFTPPAARPQVTAPHVAPQLVEHAVPHAEHGEVEPHDPNKAEVPQVKQPFAKQQPQQPQHPFKGGKK